MNSKTKSKIISGTLLCTMCAYTLPVFAYTKDETVYSKMNSKGEKYQTIVSTHIENDGELELINDMSDLMNIENTNGDEEFTQEGNSLVWKADKKDIYYQGESQKDLPIECNVKYQLDGKEVKAEEILGKSGHVKITIQYTNKEEHMVNINGRQQKMYTPFVVVAGTVLQNDTNKNIEISNGKVINDGSKAMVMGIALPGLQESLNVKKADMEIPNDIEITMDATDFELGNIITFVTPKVLEEKDLDIFDELDEIYGQVNTLQSASNQIQEGSQTLADGTNQLASGAKELKEGTNVAYSGAKQIQSEVTKATNTLANDSSDALDEKTLKSIETQAEQASTLTDQQKELIIAEADKGIDAQANTIKAQFVANAKQIAEETAIKTALEVAQTTAKQTAKEIAISVAKQTAKQAAIQTAKTLNPNLPNAQLEAIGNQAANNATLSDAQLKTIENQAASKATLSEAQRKQIKAQADMGIEAKREMIEQQGIVSAKQIAEKTAIISAQAGATTAAKKTATTVASQVGNQVKSVATKQVTSQMKTLGNGLNQLTDGLNSLNEGANTLDSGANELNQGANTLAQGVKTFNEDGIKKICNYVNGDLKDMTERVEKLTELSKEYNNFTMLNGENGGNVKFIMIMDAIKKQENEDSSKEQAIFPSQKGDNGKEE